MLAKLGIRNANWILHSLIELMLMDALWCTVAPLHFTGDRAAAEEAGICTGVAQVSLMSFIQPPLLVSHGFAVSVSGLGHVPNVLCVFLCALCSSETFKIVKQKWHRFFRTLYFSNHEPACHKRHHESRLHTGWRGQTTATRCVSSPYRSIMKRAWSRRHDLFQRQLLHGPDLSEFRRWNKETPKTQRSCCREVAKKHKTCEHQNYSSLNWLCSNFVELNVW